MKIQLGVKTNGNFGGFPVVNDILSNFGISLGNPHMCAICKTYILYAGSRLPTVPNDSYRFWADLPLEGHV
jgi:hypothetical protein